MSASNCANAPFDHPEADIILRSSDGVHFRVFKLFLSLASSFFEALFSIPQPIGGSIDQEAKDGLAVISVTEDSKTLDALLRFCYPCTLADDPRLEVLDNATDVLMAARKYSLDAIKRKACKAILNPKVLEADPFRCFAIAHRERFREETLLAARYTLTQPLIPSWFREIELITAVDLLSLLTYHRKCEDAVYALKLDLSWFMPPHHESSEVCTWMLSRPHRSRYYGDCLQCPRPNTPRYKLLGLSPLLWWQEFMESTFTALQDRPCKETVEASAKETVRAVQEKDCSCCRKRVGECMREFSRLFMSKVEETVSKVDFELSFH